ncbi:uncharacterized protein LOC135468845 [Liolophura sinensis]|uniref:uncharacterized protein LOC135468845 n=1 Tax=Liolophura sinensis TaxID=3198878 RepID=UPI003158B56D
MYSTHTITKAFVMDGALSPCDQEQRGDLSSPECLYVRDGYLYCGYLRVVDIKKGVESRFEQSGVSGSATPFYLYNQARIEYNLDSYTSALDKLAIPYILGYAAKANHNLEILSVLRKHSQAVSLTLVSGNELLLALKAGFEPRNLVLNGNGKKRWELKLGVEKGCLINVDSEFGLYHTVKVCNDLGKSARVLLRINPDIDPDVHPYISTGLGETKFGVELDGLEPLLEKIRDEPLIQLVGLHSHLGSTIDNTRVFRESVEKMLELTNKVKQMGFKDIKYIDIGGGLGINYAKYANRTLSNQHHAITWDADKPREILQLVSEKLKAYPETREILRTLIGGLEDKTLSLPQFVDKVDSLLADHPAVLRAVNHLLPDDHQLQISVPTPEDLISSIQNLLQDADLTLILEPGRSIVGDCGCLVTEVIGCKKNGKKNFIVVDGAMTEVIRPSLYGAYHHVELAEPTSDPEFRVFDVVGPVCESGDFLAKDRLLAKPHEGCTLVVFDAGAYCSSMGSNYNMRARPAEVMVDGNTWRIIREPETFDDLAKHSGQGCLDAPKQPVSPQSRPI